MAFLKRKPWLQWLPGPTWHIATTVEAADEVPEVLPLHGAVLVGTPSHPKWLAFDCPCESGHRIMISLDRGRRPRWVVRRTGALTIWPSVDYDSDDRRCHYIVRNGRVLWINDRERGDYEY